MIIVLYGFAHANADTCVIGLCLGESFFFLVVNLVIDNTINVRRQVTFLVWQPIF